MQAERHHITVLSEAQSAARDWLMTRAAPLWASAGVLPDGMFAERILKDGAPAADMPRRLRVQARQIYSFCLLGELGWPGPWRACVDRAVDLLLGRGLRPDGLCVHLFDAQGQVAHAGLDLYDHAFCLLALAHAARLGREDARRAAVRMRDVLLAEWQRPEGGFHEGDLTSCPPYRQNPHMHMFEACLAHRDGGDAVWGEMADRLRQLFTSRFCDPLTGAVTEYFDANWQRVAGDAGEIVEPGHCLEWAWLLETASPDAESRALERIPKSVTHFSDPDARKNKSLERRSDSIRSEHALSDGLTGFARAHGIDAARGVAINEVWRDGRIKDASARLWPQTERLKAAIIRYRREGSAVEAEEIVAAWRGLERFFATPVPGLWFDRMNSEGGFTDEAAPASSFYHIVCALNELLRL